MATHNNIGNEYKKVKNISIEFLNNLKYCSQLSK